VPTAHLRGSKLVDNLSPTQRSFCMSQVRSKGTDIEHEMRSALRRAGLRFKTNVTSLPGSPDIVFLRCKVAIFLDGDFWHGYRFSLWAHTLSPFWKQKIALTRKRDQRNFRKLRRAGWVVIRVWQHQMRSGRDHSVNRIVRAVHSKQAAWQTTGSVFHERT
jgi:DNA mismatch endonuclease, patch repair protein